MTKRIANILSLFNLMAKYPTKQDAIAYFERLRWGDQVKCSRCECDSRVTPQKKFPGRYWCGACRNYFTALTNTPLEYNKIDPRKWLFAAYLLLTARKGISSLQMSKELDVSQKASWYMLHRLRVACGDDLEALSGEVEMDTTYIGGKEKNKHSHKKLNQGRGTVGKQAVVGIRSRDGEVRARVVDSENTVTVMGLALENVEEGSTIYTDEATAYNQMSKFYDHKRVNHSAKEFVNGMASTNSIESVWAVLKRGFNGVYHNWSRKHCQKYVNEFIFRLNKGDCQIDTQDRIDSLFRDMVGKTITYDNLTSDCSSTHREEKR